MTSRVTYQTPAIYDCHGRISRSPDRHERWYDTFEEAVEAAKRRLDLAPEVLTSVPTGEHVCMFASDGTEVWYERPCRPRINVVG